MNKAIKERKLNYTFALKPSTKSLLDKISANRNIPMGVVIENIVLEKARKLKLIEG